MKIDTSELDQVGRDIVRNAGRVGARASAAFRKTIHDIERDAKTAAPVDTGALKNSISSEITGDGRSGTMAGEVGPTVDYGLWQEIGTSRMPPQPYLAPAFDRRIDPFTRAIAQIGGEVLW